MVAGKDAKGKPPAKAGGKSGKEEKSVDDSFEPIKVDARLANTAVLMLDSPEEDVLQKACESIFKFCEKSENNRQIVHELGATPKIFALTSHEERAIQRNATMAFGILSAHPEVRKYLRKNPTCIEKMISFLSADFDPLTNEYAAMWIRNMCEDYSTKTIVAMTPGALASLIVMLSSNDADAVFNSLGAIDRLMDDFQTRQLIRETKGIEPLIGLMKSEFPQIQELVFSSLAKITHNAENREAFRELGGLEKLVDFLGNPDQKDMHINCLNVLSNCLEDTQCLDLIQQTGGLTKILSYCQESDDPEVSNVNAAAAKALARSARKSENRKILNEQCAEKMLIYLLLSDNDETKSAAAHALSVMAESTFCQDAIRNYEGIETLVRLCSAESPKVREYACLALSNLTNKNSNNRRHIFHNQGLEVLVNLMKDERDSTKAYACISLTNMASDEIIREEVGQLSFAQSITPALSSSNNFTQAKACLTVAAFCVDSSIRNELKMYGAIPLIVQHIKSNNDDVRFNACWAITCCAVDIHIAADFCRHGAIEILRDINQSSQRRSTFTETALKKLLEANLSAKYALTNQISPTDKINDGFYDMGPMRPNGKFYSLDDLFQNPVNDKRPIIIVYAPDEKPQTPADSIKLESSIKSKAKSGAASATPKANKDKDSKDSKSKGKKASADVKKTSGGAGTLGAGDELNRTASTTNLNTSLDEGNPTKPKDSILFGMDVYKPNFDKDLKIYFDQIKDFFLNQPPKEQAISLAKFVSEKLGGPISRDEINNLGYELLINELKYELKSNIVPLGKIRLGTYYHRALLYKVLADKLFLKVSLERGDYNRAWNTVALKDENSVYPPKIYLVDLMHEPGKLMLANSIDAIQYVKL